MDKKLGTAALALALLVGLGAGSALTRVARADMSVNADGSCGTSAPCLTESNTAGGPGVKSTSTHGNGLVATTNAIGSSSQNAANALLGEDLQTKVGNGVMNAGVKGTSANGMGVQGLGQVGVDGMTSSASGIGVLASAPVGAMLFEGGSGGSTMFSIDGSGRAAFGKGATGLTGQVAATQTCGSGNPTFEGETQGGGFFQVTDCGDVLTSGSVAAASGLFASDIMPFSFQQVRIDAPLSATGGILSFAQTAGGTNYVATDAASVTWLYQGYSTTAGKYTVEMGDSGSVYARIFITMGESRVAQQTASGRRVDTYAPQVTQPSIEDFGEAQLVEGSASVSLDPKFASAIDNTVRYYVTLTPEGDCRGLYVAQRDATNFTVRELQDGRSSIAFTYRIVAKPLGDNSPRLPESTLPYGFDHQVPPPQHPHVRPRAHPPNENPLR